MPADPIHPDQLDGEQRFGADLVAYLDSLPVGQLAELLSDLLRSRQEPLGAGRVDDRLNERLSDSFKLLPPAIRAQTRGGAARCGRRWPTGAPPAPAGTLMRLHRGWASGLPTCSDRPACRPSGPGRARWPGGG